MAQAKWAARVVCPRMFCSSRGIPPPVVQLLPAVTGGIHAGSSVQGVHTETGVVRDGGQPAGRADGLGLQHGVFHKGGAGLLRLQGDAQLLLALDLIALSLQDAADLFQFYRRCRWLRR